MNNDGRSIKNPSARTFVEFYSTIMAPACVIPDFASMPLLNLSAFMGRHPFQLPAMPGEESQSLKGTLSA